MPDTSSAPADLARTGVMPATDVAFDGPRGPLFWLLVRNLLLTVVTLGIYRFWAKTRVRRLFWRHTRLMDEPFEYLGTGGELFIGFLIALVVLVPVSGLYSLLQFFTLGTEGNLPLAIDLAYYLLIAFLVQIAIYRMRRYRLTRTVWRSVRFGLDGSSFRYALISFLYGCLTLLTLGLARPWLRIATMRYLFNNARFGTSPLSLAARAGWLFPRWLFVAVPAATGIVAFAALNWPELEKIYGLLARAGQGEEVDTDMGSTFAAMNGWPLLLLVLGYGMSIWYRVVEFRYLAGNIRIGDTGLNSTLGAGYVYLVLILFWVLAAGLIAFLGVLVWEAVKLVPNLAVLLPPLMIVAILVGYGFYGIARTLFLDLPLLKRACIAFTVTNPHALERTVQSSADLPGHGEGLADALDVGGF